MYIVDSMSDKKYKKKGESAAVCQYFMSLLKAKELYMQTSTKDEVEEKKIIAFFLCSLFLTHKTSLEFFTSITMC